MGKTSCKKTLDFEIMVVITPNYITGNEWGNPLTTDHIRGGDMGTRIHSEVVTQAASDDQQ